MFYQLPPAGNTISLNAGSPIALSPGELFHPLQAVFCNSGTAALAAAITAATRLKEVRAPEVILPAYGCPDLVSAVLFAGARPVLVDLEPERPWMDLGRLASVIGPQTVAIVAVSLCGVPERMQEISDIARRSSLVLIEDSAQAFPNGDMGSFWRGDLVVLSFGRGKPVSLLGGGAVLYRDDKFRRLLPVCKTDTACTGPDQLAFRLQARLYNSLSSARAYWVPAGLPFLHLGETRFQPLDTVQCMDAPRLQLLAANIDSFRRRSLRVQTRIADLCRENSERTGGRLVDLPVACKVPGSRPLLRYPLLLDIGYRDMIYNCMRRKGLGASIMYPAILPDTAGLEHRLGPGNAFPAAREFAARVLTLPVHDRVRDVDIQLIADCLDMAT
jgi:dTDP-4-amino-4,6-dideoxygalactose transaminase